MRDIEARVARLVAQREALQRSRAALAAEREGLAAKRRLFHGEVMALTHLAGLVAAENRELLLKLRDALQNGQAGESETPVPTRKRSAA